jgi:hypothetical protein
MNVEGHVQFVGPCESVKVAKQRGDLGSARAAVSIYERPLYTPRWDSHKLLLTELGLHKELV